MPPTAWMRIATAGARPSPSGAGGSSVGQVLGHGAAGHGEAVAVEQAGVEQLPSSRPARRRCGRGRSCGTGRGASCRRCGAPGAATRLKSSSSRSTLRLVGDGEQVQHGVGRAAQRHRRSAMAFSNASLVMICRGRMPGFEQADHGRGRWPEAKSSRRRSTAGADAEPGSAMPSASADRRHGVGGEHAGAGALGRAGVALDGASSSSVDGARPRRRRPPRTR